MRSLKAIQNSKLGIVGFNPPVSIVAFENYSGTLDQHNFGAGLREGFIQSDEGKIVWSGILHINEDSTFDLCVKPNGENEIEVVKWKDLPPFFTVFDGGYEPLVFEKVNELLDDLIEFGELVQVRCHFESNEKYQSISGKWSNQENIKALAEIFIGFETNTGLLDQQVVLIEFELFETVYFAIAFHEESFDDGIIISLTSHFYQQRNRIGRRIPIEPIEIDGFTILEVSDFGMKVSVNSSHAPDTARFQIKIHDYGLEFGVVYRRNLSTDETIMGLHLEDYSPDARKAWQSFLMVHQYPLLQNRKPENHDDIWKLLDESGYLANTRKSVEDRSSTAIEEIVKINKSSIEREWHFVDASGPGMGQTVIGYSNEQPVCTIGVSKAFGKVWTAQTAAMIDKPELMPFTRSVYSWRTRFILQQPDADYHLAFFLKNKKFLDRFFRKFLITRSVDDQEKIVWDEYFFYWLIEGSEHGLTGMKTGEPANGGLVNQFLKLKNALTEGEMPGELTVNDNTLNISCRPFTHMAQYLNSVITCVSQPENLDDILAKKAPVTVLATKSPFDFETVSLPKSIGVFGGHEEVIWVAPRSLLPDFLQNSLKALEAMSRKYSSRRVA